MIPLARSFTTALCAASLLIAAPLLAQEINVDYDHNFQFSQTKSYSWGKIETADPMVEPRVTAAVDRVLQGYGFKESDKNKKGDVIVTAIEATNPQGYTRFYRSVAIVDWHRGWGSGGFADGVTSLRQIHPGTLIIDIYDGATHKLIWRGTATQTPSAVAKEQDESKQKLGYNTLDPAHVDKTVDTLFANYPPKTGGALPPNQHEVRLGPSSQGSESPN
jgi:Domain of unknown function (DUF4136)